MQSKFHSKVNTQNFSENVKVNVCTLFFFSFFESIFRFTVSFVPAEACDHIISVSFNKVSVPNCPITVPISGSSAGPQVMLSGPGPVHLPNSLTINHADGHLEDIEVNVEGII